ncbi:MAG TPA: hypothetical protein VIB07_05330 [Nitrososphaera sp.]|jgi:hypothetical protein
MAIEWDSLVVEMVLLAAIIYGSVYVGNLVEKRKQRHDEKEDAKRIIRFVMNDLHKKQRFIDESIQYKDYKPFFTDMWDAVILGGKQKCLPFEMFENLQHTYSWMKYYNNELEQREKSGDATVLDTLSEVKGSISQSLQLMEKNKL